MLFLFPQPRTIAIICLLTFSLSPLFAVEGDVNLDLIINRKDLFLLNAQALGVSVIPAGGELNADLNGDGRITISDSMLLAKRLKENQVVLKSLDHAAARPGSLLEITAENISGSEQIYVRFVNPQGSVIDIIATVDGAQDICVQVPVFTDVLDWLPLSGTVSISVLRVDDGVIYESDTTIDFNILGLPELDGEPGDVTLEALEELDSFLDEIRDEWELLEIVSLFEVKAASFRNDLDELGDELDDLHGKIGKLQSGEIDEIEIGELGGKTISLNRDSLELLDQLLAAHYLNDHDVGGADCDTFRECMGDEFELEDILDSIRLLSKYNKYRRTGYSASGNAASATRTFKSGTNLPTHANNSLAAFLQFSNLTPTAVLAAHSHSHAAPFTIFNLGRPAELSDYDSFLEILDRDSVDFFADWDRGEIQDIFDELFNDADASQTLRKILDETEVLLDRVDLDDLENSIWGAFDSAEVIYRALF